MSTIVFPDHHSAVADAETLKKAFHGNIHSEFRPISTYGLNIIFKIMEYHQRWIKLHIFVVIYVEFVNCMYI